MTDEWYKRAKLEEMREQTAVMRDIWKQLTALELLIASCKYNHLVKVSSNDQVSEDLRAKCREMYLETIEAIAKMEGNK